MIAKLRRVIIAARYTRTPGGQSTPEEITEIQLAWAAAGA
jgi:hypothetical protein